MKSKRKNRDSEWSARPLRYALGAGEFQEAEKLLREDPSLLDANVYGSESALHFWAVENRPDVVEWLLERGADPNRMSAGTGCALADSAFLGLTDMCRLLIGAGADLTCRGVCGETLLHMASRVGRLELIELLIDSGVDVNATDGGEETPWDYALPRKAVEIRALLEKHGGESGVGWE